MKEPKIINYKATPTLSEFHKSNSPVRGIFGPIGSGKTVGCIMELFKQACQMPVCKGTNIRKSRSLIIRQTLPKLKTTTIKSMNEWLSPLIHWRMSESPIEGKLAFKLADGTIVHWEIWCMSIDSSYDEEKAKSLEITNAYFNEASESNKAIFSLIRSRTGRYPRREDCPNYRDFVILDTNTNFSEKHWLYQLFITNKPVNFDLFRQPPALLWDEKKEEWIPNEKAENIKFVGGYEYYLKMVDGVERNFIEVFCNGKFAILSSGKEVFPEYKDETHYADKALYPIGLRPVICALDFGLNPSAVFGQIDNLGTLNLLTEITTDNMGFIEFCDSILAPHIQEKYHNINVIYVADPASRQRNQVTGTSPQEVARDRGINLKYPSTNNKLDERLQAVKYFLNRQSGLMVGEDCQVVREGFNGAYHYKKLNVRGMEEVYTNEPNKNYASHCMDCVEYLALYYFKLSHRVERVIKVKKRSDDSFYR